MSNYELHFPSTFLSHSSVDTNLVEAVAERLGRRGVLAWLDKTELLELGPLDLTLKQAVQNQTTFTIFLSKASVASSWCDDEIRWALEGKDNSAHLLPVYLGDPLKLVKSHKLLRTRFLHADGDKVNQLGVFLKDPSKLDPDDIAKKIAATAYKRLALETCSDVIVFLDQRGTQQRRGRPTIPESLARLKAPTLVFRPTLGQRHKHELLTGKDWEDMAATLDNALSNALYTDRSNPRKVRVIGNAQTSLIWLVGRHFDRTTAAELYGYGRDGDSVTNKGQERHTIISGGDPSRAQQLSDDMSMQGSTIAALGVGPKENYAHAMQKAAPHLPQFWIESGKIKNSEQAMKLVKDIVAVVKQLKIHHGIDEICLFWTSANHAALLAAANLTKHGPIPRIKFMDYDRAQNEYVHLPMPGDV